MTSCRLTPPANPVQLATAQPAIAPHAARDGRRASRDRANVECHFLNEVQPQRRSVFHTSTDEDTGTERDT